MDKRMGRRNKIYSNVPLQLNFSRYERDDRVEGIVKKRHNSLLSKLLSVSACVQAVRVWKSNNKNWSIMKMNDKGCFHLDHSQVEVLIS